MSLYWESTFILSNHAYKTVSAHPGRILVIFYFKLYSHENFIEFPTHTHRLSKIILFLSAFILLFIFACEHTELLPDDESLGQPTGIENVKVVNGELYFTNPDTYFDDVQKILDMNEIELDEWEASIGFQSLRSIINEAHDAAGALTSVDQIPAWKEKYRDVVTLEDSTVTEIIQDGYYQTIANRTGEYMIGATYVKVLPDRIIMIRDGDRTRIGEAMEMEQSDFDKGILVFDNGSTYEIELRTSCGSNQTHQGVSQNGNRKAHLKMNVKELSSGGYSRTKVTIDQYGEKKGLFWSKYNTQHQLQDVNFEVYDNDNLLVTLFTDYAYLQLLEVKTYRTSFYFDDITPSNYYTITPKWESVKGRSTTRGTDRQWATVCCGNYTTCPQTVGDSYFTP